MTFKRHLQWRYFSIWIHFHVISQSQCLLGPHYSAMSIFKASFCVNTVQCCLPLEMKVFESGLYLLSSGRQGLKWTSEWTWWSVLNRDSGTTYHSSQVHSAVRATRALPQSGMRSNQLFPLIPAYILRINAWNRPRHLDYHTLNYVISKIRKSAN